MSSSRPMDVIYGIGQEKKRPSSPLEDLRLSQQQDLADQAQINRSRQMVLETEKGLLETEKQVRRLRGEDGDTSSSGLSTDAQLLNELVKNGMEFQKATETIARMDPMTRARVYAIYSKQGGADQMMAWSLLANQPQTSPNQAVEAASKILDMVEKRTAQPNSQPPLTIQDLFAVMDRVKPGEETDRAMNGLYNKIDRLEEDLKTEREARHQADLIHAQEMANERQKNLESQIAVLGTKLDEIKAAGPGAKGDTLGAFRETVTTLRDIGLPIAIGAEATPKSPLEETNEIVKTVMNSPGIGKITDAVADTVRNRGFRGGQGAVVGPAVVGRPSAPQTGEIFCDSCLSQGRRTPLPITPGLMAGTEAVTCPVCGQSYRRGGAPPPAGGSPPGGPSGGPGRPWTGLDPP